MGVHRSCQGGFHLVSEIAEKNVEWSAMRSEPQTKEKAHRIPKCWRRLIQELLVSLSIDISSVMLTSRQCFKGEVCVHCETQCGEQPSLPRNQLCWRSGFKEYETTFFPSSSSPCPLYYILTFPEFMHAHLRKDKMEDLILEHTSGFLETELTLEVSTGLVFIPMRIHTNTFLPNGHDLLQQSSLTPAEADEDSQLVQRHSVPIGILGLSLTEMRKKCNNHIFDMISNTQYAAQATAGDISQLPKQILEIVCEYSAAKHDASFPPNLVILLLTNIQGSTLAECAEAPRHALFHGLSHNLFEEFRSRDLLQTLPNLNTPIICLITSTKPTDQIRDAQIASRDYSARA
ncbi:MAG: hypothetical protein MMC33_009534 [Icmadophila ericetorum]|nr:hypothetical protein [Icmadophila ericetorum]